eukprot:Awhi_evm2s3907
MLIDVYSRWVSDTSTAEVHKFNASLTLELSPKYLRRGYKRAERKASLPDILSTNNRTKSDVVDMAIAHKSFGSTVSEGNAAAAAIGNTDKNSFSDTVLLARNNSDKNSKINNKDNSKDNNNNNGLSGEPTVKYITPQKATIQVEFHGDNDNFISPVFRTVMSTPETTVDELIRLVSGRLGMNPKNFCALVRKEKMKSNSSNHQESEEENHNHSLKKGNSTSSITESPLLSLRKQFSNTSLDLSSRFSMKRQNSLKRGKSEVSLKRQSSQNSLRSESNFTNIKRTSSSSSIELSRFSFKKFGLSDGEAEQHKKYSVTPNEEVASSKYALSQRTTTSAASSPVTSPALKRMSTFRRASGSFAEFGRSSTLRSASKSSLDLNIQDELTNKEALRKNSSESFVSFSDRDDEDNDNHNNNNNIIINNNNKKSKTDIYKSKSTVSCSTAAISNGKKNIFGIIEVDMEEIKLNGKDLVWAIVGNNQHINIVVRSILSLETSPLLETSSALPPLPLSSNPSSKSSSLQALPLSSELVANTIADEFKEMQNKTKVKGKDNETAVIPTSSSSSSHHYNQDLDETKIAKEIQEVHKKRRKSNAKNVNYSGGNVSLRKRNNVAQKRKKNRPQSSILKSNPLGVSDFVDNDLPASPEFSFRDFREFREKTRQSAKAADTHEAENKQVMKSPREVRKKGRPAHGESQDFDLREFRQKTRTSNEDVQNFDLREFRQKTKNSNKKLSDSPLNSDDYTSLKEEPNNFNHDGDDMKNDGRLKANSTFALCKQKSKSLDSVQLVDDDCNTEDEGILLAGSDCGETKRPSLNNVTLTNEQKKGSLRMNRKLIRMKMDMIESS